MYEPTTALSAEAPLSYPLTQDGVHARLLALERENAALRLANRQLTDVSHQKDAVIDRLCLQLRTPLNFITGFASILGDEIPGRLNPQQQAYIGKILSGADRIMRMVNTLMDAASLEAGTFVLDPQPTDYAALVASVVDTLKPLAEHKMIRLQAKVDVATQPLIDAQRTAQVLSNILSNAIKFNPDGGVVRIRAFQEGDELVTQISDGGPGIHPDDMPRLFNRIGVLDVSHSDSASMGLGLAISKRLVESHGGRIGLDSAYGEGCTFWFVLPLGTA